MCTRPNTKPRPLGPQYASTSADRDVPFINSIALYADESVNAAPKPSMVCFGA